MQNAQRHGFKKKNPSTNQFNNSEYDRWSEGLKAIQSGKTQCEIVKSLGTAEDPLSGHETISVSWKEIVEK
jgi:hypothetical protein